jgi:hypothetical protein
MTAAEITEETKCLRDWYPYYLELNFVDEYLHIGEHCSSRRPKRDTDLNLCKWSSKLDRLSKR